MAKNYKDITGSISANIAELKKDIPDVMNGFYALSKAATADGVLDKKTKEFVALAIGVATRCDGCIGFHSKALAKLGASKEEVEEVLGMAVYMGGGPSLMYAADALGAFKEFFEG